MFGIEIRLISDKVLVILAEEGLNVEQAERVLEEVKDKLKKQALLVPPQKLT